LPPEEGGGVGGRAPKKRGVILRFNMNIAVPCVYFTGDSPLFPDLVYGNIFIPTQKKNPDFSRF